MNKIDRLVWNKRTGRLVVASEFASAQGGSMVDARHNLTRLGALSAAILLGLWASGAMAQDAVCYDPVTGLPVGSTTGAGSEIACGDGAVASGAHAVALGTAATALGANSVAAISGGATGYNPTGATQAQIDAIQATNSTTLGAVSVGTGAAGGNRQIVNVAAGTTDSDAVNVAQLKAVQNAAAAAQTHYYSVNDGGTQQGNYNNDGATGVGSLAAGVAASASGINAVAVGPRAVTVAPQSIVIGNNARAVPYGTLASNGLPLSATDAIAVGNNAYAGNNYSVAIGPGARATKRQGIAIGHNARVEWSGQVSDDVRGQGIAIGAGAFVLDSSGAAIAIGSGAGVESGNTSMAIGNGARSLGTIAVSIGGQNRATGDTNISVGERTQTTGFDTTAVGIYATAGRNERGSGVMSASAFGAHAAAQGRGSTSMGAGSLVFGTGSGSIAANSPIATRVYFDAKDHTAFSLIGGSNNFSVGNRNVIGATSSNNVAFGNDIHIGASGASFQEVLSSAGTVNDLRHYVPTFQNQVAISNAVAVGSTAHVAASNAVAVGASSRAVNANDVALGSGSLTSAGTPTASGSVGGINYAYAGATPTSVVSIGSAGNERQVQNVAAGRVSAASTDAINGSQLYVTQVALGNLAVSTAAHFGGGSVVNADGSISAPMYTIGGVNYYNVGDALAAIQVGVAAGQTHYFSVNDGGTQQGNYNNDGATGINSLAAGPNSTATAENAVAIGSSASAAGVNGLSLGTSSFADGAYSTAVGTGTVAGDFATVIGGNAVGGYRDVAIGAAALADLETGVNAPKGTTNSTGLNTAIGTIAGYQIAGGQNAYVGAGAGARVTGSNNVAIGMLAGSSVTVDPVAGTINPGGAESYSDAVNVGNGTKALKDRATALGAGAVANISVGDVALGAGSTTAAVNPTSTATVGPITYGGFAGATPTSVVSIGSAGNERQVQNVAAGRVSATSTDAINGSQLYVTQVALGNLAVSTAAHFGGGSVVNADGSISAPTYTIGGANYYNVGDALAAIQVGVAAGQTHYVSINSTGGGNYANDGATGVDAIAIGKDAVAAHDRSVALGQGATTAAAVGTSSATIAGTSYTFAGAAPTGTVSVGTAGAERTITNVAAGRIAADSTDAVNGSQLHATNQAIEAVDGRVTNLEVTVGAITGDITNLTNDVNELQTGAAGMFQVSQDVNTPPPAPTGANSAAGGAGAVASGDNSTAVGNGSSASGANSTALGNGASASGDGSIAIGVGSVASDPNTLSVGAAGNERRITNVAAGVNPTDAVNVSQLQGFTAGGVQYDKNADGSVNYGSVTLNPGGSTPTTIRNVAAGVAPTDAVNVGQLDAGLANVLSQANAYTDNSIRQLRDDMWTTNRGYRAATASAMAMTGLPQAYLPGKSMLAVGAGGYQGEYGMAIGLSGITEDGRWVYKAQASGNTSDDWGFAVGAGIQW